MPPRPSQREWVMMGLAEYRAGSWGLSPQCAPDSAHVLCPSLALSDLLSRTALPTPSLPLPQGQRKVILPLCPACPSCARGLHPGK